MSNVPAIETLHFYYRVTPKTTAISVCLVEDLGKLATSELRNGEHRRQNECSNNLEIASPGEVSQYEELDVVTDFIS